MGIPEVAIQLLQADLQQLPERIRDEKFSNELYCALANNRWSKDGEQVTVDPTIQRELIERFGWSVEPLDTSRRDPVHVDDPAG